MDIVRNLKNMGVRVVTLTFTRKLLKRSVSSKDVLDLGSMLGGVCIISMTPMWMELFTWRFRLWADSMIAFIGTFCEKA